VKGLVLFGSQVRNHDDHIWSADVHSDWDFHIITSRPKMFLESTWLKDVTGLEQHAYAVRTPRFGGMPKVNVALAGCEADLVIFPFHTFQAARLGISLGLHRHSLRLRRKLQDLAIVIRPGWKFLKGATSWEAMYNKVIAEVEDPRLDDDTVRNLAEAFVCDYIWARRKLDRGELIAVQRILHRELAETNLRLLHELKLRRGERTFPDARRLERIATAEQVNLMSISSRPEAGTLREAIEQHAGTLRGLSKEILGDTWRWPAI